MTYETLLKKYVKKGYQPVGLQPEDECQRIVRWLWDTYKIHIFAMYCDWNVPIKPSPYRKFTVHYRYDCGRDYSNTFYGSKYFDNPAEAYFDGLRLISKANYFRFQM